MDHSTRSLLFLLFFLGSIVVIIPLTFAADSTTSTTAVVCPYQYTALGGRCFKKIAGNFTFDQAKTLCESEMTTLAEINSDEEFKTIQSITEPDENFYWMKGKYPCQKISLNWTEWNNQSNKYMLETRVMFEKHDGWCCLSFHPKAANSIKYWWMPCNENFNAICAIHSSYLTKEHLKESLRAVIDKCRQPINLNMTEFGINVNRLKSILDKYSEINSNTGFTVTFGICFSWLGLLTLFTFYKWYKDREQSGEYCTELKNQQNYYEGITGPDEYASYAASPSVLNSTES